MTEVIFSFDTEDFTSCEAVDAIIKEADILKSEGINGCFQVVGLLAKQIKSWGREDTVKALASHEVDFHTFGHTFHPTIDEYTDIEDFDKAYEMFIKQETEGMNYVKDTFKVDKFVSACPPGNSNTYVAMYGYADLGFPVYCATFPHTPEFDGVYYCNIFHIPYTYNFEQVCFPKKKQPISHLVTDLKKYKRVVLCTHPQMAIYSNFWDKLNYDKYNMVEFGKWKTATKRPERDTKVFYQNLRRLIRLLKNDGDFKFTTYGEIAKNALDYNVKRVIAKKDIPEIKKQLLKNFGPVKTKYSLSLYDVLMAVKSFILGKDEYVCGKSFGFLEKPFGVSEKTEVTDKEIKESVKQLNIKNFLPPFIMAGNNKIGVADWLMASIEVLEGKKKVIIQPKDQLPCLDVLPEVKESSLKGTWLHSDDFEDKYLSDRLRYQVWTLRYE